MTDRPTNQTDRPALRPAAPEHESVHGYQPTGHRPATRPDQSTTRPARPVGSVDQSTDQTKATDTDRQPPASEPTDHAAEATSRFRQWRQRKTAAANAAKQPTDLAAVADAAAAHRRPTTTRPGAAVSRPTDETDIAPIPANLKWLGVWLDRTFGTMPLIAPLIVSGYFTMQVFQDAPINAWPAVAFLATLALEGGVWKLSRLYEKTLVAGDSTIALRLGIAMYLGLISGLIYWHAASKQAQLSGTDLNIDTLAALGAGDTFPAFGTAVMSALGVFIWSRTARWQRRRELHAAGRIDMQMPKFSVGAWLLTPVETPQALRHAIKFRIESPRLALDDLRLYKSAGRPSMWPPIRPAGESTADRTDRTGCATDRTAITPTRPEETDLAVQRPTDAPTRPQSVAPVTDRPSTPTTQTRPSPPAPRPQSTITPTAPTDAPTDRPTFTPAAIRNAGILRDTYGTRTDLRLGTVRSDLRWSFDRADPALKAYLAGADQPTDQTEEPVTGPTLAHVN